MGRTSFPRVPVGIGVRAQPSHLTLPLLRGSRPAEPAALAGEQSQERKRCCRPLALALEAATEQHSNYSNGVSAEQWGKYILQKVYNCVIFCWQNPLQKDKNKPKNLKPRMKHFQTVICTPLTCCKLAEGSAGGHEVGTPAAEIAHSNCLSIPTALYCFT